MLQIDTLRFFWNQLLKCNHLVLKTQSKDTIQIGRATVLILQPSELKMIYREKGIWLEGAHQNTLFHNVFCWCLNPKTTTLHLSHLRYGYPICLFRFAPKSSKQLISMQPYVCKLDRYQATMLSIGNMIKLQIRVTSTRKDTLLTYFYMMKRCKQLFSL